MACLPTKNQLPNIQTDGTPDDLPAAFFREYAWSQWSTLSARFTLLNTSEWHAIHTVQRYDCELYTHQISSEKEQN